MREREMRQGWGVQPLFRLVLWSCISLLSYSAAEESRGVFFPKKGKDVSELSRSELVFLDEAGLAVVVTAAAVNFRSGRYQGEPIELVAHDSVSRLSLIRVPLKEGEETIPVELGQSLFLEEGSPLYPSLEGESSTSRFVSRESRYKDQPLPLQLLRVHHGAEASLQAGHPLFDAAGRLVAVNYLKASEYGNGSFAFPIEAVARLMEATVENGIVQRSWFGVELLASDPFAFVQGVRQDSPAAKAGIIKGDILLSIGPRAIISYADALNAFFYLREGVEAPVQLLRGNDALQLQVMPELAPSAKEVPPKAEPAELGKEETSQKLASQTEESEIEGSEEVESSLDLEEEAIKEKSVSVEEQAVEEQAAEELVEP